LIVLPEQIVTVLLVGINKGDADAFAQLYRLYHVPLCLFAERLLKDSVAAEDLVEDAFAKLWEQRRSFNSSTHLVAFLYRSLRNSCLDAIKMQGRSVERHRAFVEEYYDIANTDYLTTMVRTELMVALHQAIELLPPQVANVIQKTYIEGKSNQEAADELGISLQTLKNHKNRGLGLLKQRMHKTQFGLMLCFIDTIRAV